MDENSAARGETRLGEEGLAVQVDELRGVIDKQAAMIESQAKLVESQGRSIDAQAKLVESLSERLERMEDGGKPSTPGRGEQATIESSSLPDLHAPTSRRNVMTKGAAVAAGAAIAGTVLNVASASPAAAAPGLFDGNPAVVGTANPTSGTGVRGNSVTGFGVVGSALSPTGNATGVWGEVTSPDADGVVGLNVATTGSARGVSGQTSSPDGFAVFANNFAATGDAVALFGTSGSNAAKAVVGIASATSGNTRGVYGNSSSTSGHGVEGLADASTGSTNGVRGTSNSTAGIGVYGNATTSSGGTVGVFGTVASTAGVGVYGGAPAGSGVTKGVAGEAVSASGYGVFGKSFNAAAGTGMYGTGGTAVEANSGRTQLRLSGTPAAPLGAGLARTAGEVVFDANQDLWLCVVSGTPGTWKRISGPSTSGAFVALAAPVRVYDSRSSFLPATGPKSKLVGDTPRTVDCTLSSSGVPVGASGVLVSLVATNTDAAGFMTIYKDGIPWPGTSNLNFAQGQTVAVTTFSALSAAAKVAVRSNVPTDVLLDVLGYYQ